MRQNPGEKAEYSDPLKEAPICANCCTRDELFRCADGSASFRFAELGDAERCRRCGRPTTGRLGLPRKVKA